MAQVLRTVHTIHSSCVLAQYSVGSDTDNAQALRDSTRQLQQLMQEDAFDEFKEVFAGGHIQDVPAYANWTPHKGRLRLAEEVLRKLHLGTASAEDGAAPATSLLRAFARAAVAHCDELPRSLAGSGAFYSPSQDAVVIPRAGAESKTIAAPSVGVIRVERDTPPPTFLSSLVQPVRAAVVHPEAPPRAHPSHTIAPPQTMPDRVPFVGEDDTSSSAHTASQHRARRTRGTARPKHRHGRKHSKSRKHDKLHGAASQGKHSHKQQQLAVRFDQYAAQSDSDTSEHSASSGSSQSGAGTLSDAGTAPPAGLNRVQKLKTQSDQSARSASVGRAPVAFSVDMTSGGGRGANTTAAAGTSASCQCRCRTVAPWKATRTWACKRTQGA